MKRAISALTLSTLCSIGFAGNPTSFNTTTAPAAGIIWIAVSPYPNSDYTQGYARISVSINGAKILSSYSMSKRNVFDPFVIGIPHYGNDRATVNVVSESTSYFSSTAKAGIISVFQGNNPYYSNQTLLVCGKNFPSC